MQVEASFFIGSILDWVKVELPYIDCIDIGNQTVEYKALKYISYHINHNLLFTSAEEHLLKNYNTLTEALKKATLTPQFAKNVLKNGIRCGIIDLIWRLRECISFAENKEGKELDRICLESEASALTTEPKIFEFSPDVRERTRLKTWQGYIDGWKTALNKWSDYLREIDLVYPLIFWNIPEVLGYLIPRHKHIFWKQFWYWLFVSRIEPTYTSSSEFQDYLIHNVAPSFILYSAKNKDLCARSFQKIINVYRSAQDYPDFFARIMQTDEMRQALMSTDITMLPVPSSLGHITRETMRDTMTARDRGAVYY
jgi:hypothetical protein